MILSAGQINSIGKGVDHWTVGPEGGLIPQRYTTQQLEVYRANERRLRNAGASTGVRLEFSTDADAFRMAFRVFRGETRNYFGLDLYVDGALYDHFRGLLTDPDHIDWVVALPGGNKTVTVYLPCSAGVEILEVRLENATVCEPVEEREEKILFLGDSITQGLDATFPSFTYATMLANHRKADFLNQGNGGEIFNPCVIEPLDWEPTMAVIAYGTNDWANKQREDITADASGFLKKFCEIWPDLPTFLITPLWRGDAKTRRTDDFRHEEVAEILQRIAAEHPQIRVICGYELVPAIPELMWDKRLHPNELGFSIYAKRLAEKLDMLCPQK